MPDAYGASCIWGCRSPELGCMRGWQVVWFGLQQSKLSDRVRASPHLWWPRSQMAHRRTSLGKVEFCWMAIRQEAPGESPFWNPAQSPLRQGGWGGSCRSLPQSHYPFPGRNALLCDP